MHSSECVETRACARPGSVKILFAGGCHVAGFPVGREHGFPEVAARLLRAAGWDVELEMVSHVPLHRPEKVTEALGRVQPDILVLQVGHFELTLPSLGEWLRSLAMRPAAGSRGKTRSSTEGRGKFEESVWAAGMWIKACLRAPIDPMLERHVRRVRRFRERMGPFCEAVAAAWRGPCLLLSPLPAAGPAISRMRRSSLSQFEAEAARHGWRFLDLLCTAPCWSGWRLGLAEWHADAAHLGRPGQRWVGEQVAREIGHMLSERACAKSESSAGRGRICEEARNRCCV